MTSKVGTMSPSLSGSRVAALASLIGLVLLGLLLRWIHLRHSQFMYDGDEAFIALIGFHIANGRHFPLIQYGSHYMGTLDALITALLFRSFGVSVEIHKLTHLLYAGLALGLIGWASWRLWGWRRAYLAVGLLAFAPSAIRWQMDSNTNYGIMLALECGMMALTVLLISDWSCHQQEPSLSKTFAWALLSGLAFWQHSLTISLFLAFLGVIWLCRGFVTTSMVGLGITGFLVGASPFLFYNVTHSFATPRTFLGFFLDITSRRQVEEGSVVRVVLDGLWKHLDPVGLSNNLYVAVRGPGFGSVGLLAVAGPIALAALGVLVVSAMVAWLRQTQRLGWRDWLSSRDGMLLSWLFLSVGFTIFLGGTRARYLSLLLPLLALIVVGKWPSALLGRTMQGALLAGLIVYATAVSVTLNIVHPDITANPFPRLVSFLEANGLSRGYADHNIAHPILLYTQEAVVVSPLAGPVMADRYPDYTAAVERASAPFYIYEEEEPLRAALIGYLQRNAIRFKETLVGRHVVVSNLSRDVRPDAFLPPSYRAAYEQDRRRALELWKD